VTLGLRWCAFVAIAGCAVNAAPGLDAAGDAHISDVSTLDGRVLADTGGTHDAASHADAGTRMDARVAEAGPDAESGGLHGDGDLQEASPDARADATILDGAGNDGSTDGEARRDAERDAGTATDAAANGAPCAAADQCTSGFCYGTPAICQATSCSDGIKDGSETGVDCGGADCALCPTVLLVGAGASSSIGAELHPTPGQNGTWSQTTPLDAPSVSDLGIAFIGSGATSEAVSVMRYTLTGNASDQAVVYATWAPGTTTGTWSPFAGIAAGVTAREVPAITGSGSTAFATFQGTDFNLYFAAYTGGAWSPTAEAVGVGGVPTPAGIATVVGSNPSVAYFSNANQATSDTRVGTWQTPVTVDSQTADESFVATPSIVTTSGGTAELLMAFIRQSDGAILYATRTAGVWSLATPVGGAYAPAASSFGPVERVALAALPAGGAILGWRDSTTSGAFSSLYNGTAWSAPTPFSTPNVTLSAAPALAHGVAGATAEIAFVESDGIAYSARLVLGAWTGPVAVGGTTLSHVTLTSAP
jgi:hypothetical protein